jgi:YegS/Rv2252/BmrU family lipid kinase
LHYPARVPAPTLVILNPASRAGSTGRRFEEIEPRLRDALGPLEVARTRAPRDAERIAREGVRAGVERLVVAGGDGTTSEVVTGLLAAGLAGDASLAVLPLGTGGDLVRTLGVPRDLDAALELLARGETRRIDAGRVDYRARGGAPRIGYFANVASLGVSGLVDECVERAPRWLGGSAAFLLASLQAIVRFRPAPVRLRVDGELVHDGPLTLAAAANGRYFGGGMQIAPGARPDDGLFDVVCVAGLAKPRLVASLPALYRGDHLGRPGVEHRRGKIVEAEPTHGEVLLDVDGEPLGVLPARFEILPGALAVFGAGS